MKPHRSAWVAVFGLVLSAAWAGNSVSTTSQKVDKSTDDSTEVTTGKIKINERKSNWSREIDTHFSTQKDEKEGTTGEKASAAKEEEQKTSAGRRRDSRIRKTSEGEMAAKEEKPMTMAKRDSPKGASQTAGKESTGSASGSPQAKAATSVPKAAPVARAAAPRPAARRPAAKAPAAGAPGELAGDAAPPAKGAKVRQMSHVLLLRDGTKLPCSLICKGPRSIVVMTETGEMEFDPKDIEQVRLSDDEQQDPVFAASVTEDGHQRLLAPEPGEETVAMLPSTAASSTGTPAAPAAGTTPAMPEGPAQAPSRVPGTPQTPAPGTARPTAPALPAPLPVLGAPGTILDRPKDAQTSKPSVAPAPVNQLDALHNARQKAEGRDPAEASKDNKDAKKPQGFTDLLKALETKGGVEGVLEQLRSNPDFFKEIDIAK